jgi:hypothetical protein
MQFSDSPIISYFQIHKSLPYLSEVPRLPVLSQNEMKFHTRTKQLVHNNIQSPINMQDNKQ